MLLLRHESPDDIEAIDSVNRTAFDGPGEADLVKALRDADGVVLSLVAELEGIVVGHILFSPASVVQDETSRPIIALAPMGVLPEHQRSGIGSALVVEGLQQLREAGHGAVAVLGHKEFYPRFGFVPAHQHNISCEYPVAPEYFMVTELQPGALNSVSGTVKYHPAFAGL